MHRTATLAATLALVFAAAQATAADAPTKSGKAGKPTPAAKAAPVVEEAALSQGQLDVAPRVFVGRADCEFAQSVEVNAIDGKPGYFKVAFGKASYTMTPQETSTGAVRLEDRRAGAVWLQIPAKSMLMDAKAGRRLVDSCMHVEQRDANVAAGTSVAAVQQ